MARKAKLGYQASVYRWILQCCLYNNRIDLFGKIRFEWSKKLHSYDGLAFIDANLIRFSEKYWKKANAQQRRRLVMHEVCHLLCPSNENHGRIWKLKMANCGFPNATRWT